MAAKDGVTPEQLARDLRQDLPPTVEAKTGAQQAQEASDDISDFTKIIRYFLLAFGAIALFVGAFVIFNTLSITVAQRTREFATLRTIGASRRQLLGSVIVEALVIGIVASLLGLVLGFALARGINALFVALDLDLPTTSQVYAPRTFIVAVLIGVVVTVLAGLAPADARDARAADRGRPRGRRPCRAAAWRRTSRTSRASSSPSRPSCSATRCSRTRSTRARG